MSDLSLREVDGDTSQKALGERRVPIHDIR
ncbi:MAG: hypothetical protein QOF20_3040 [Acidimicrobiaceae bacterium]|jgi:hypothetical protein|nr:hypothetical protein [Acidimicrobiaceae bacterium]MDQ1399727.1 hypothetical protein [Acidimicrobiaceae bacterium]MDQ1443512.1 hypothetical protein [Acidimicrobiaceae bacterium]